MNSTQSSYPTIPQSSALGRRRQRGFVTWLQLDTSLTLSPTPVSLVELGRNSPQVTHVGPSKWLSNRWENVTQKISCRAHFQEETWWTLQKCCRILPQSPTEGPRRSTSKNTTGVPHSIHTKDNIGRSLPGLQREYTLQPLQSARTAGGRQKCPSISGTR